MRRAEQKEARRDALVAAALDLFARNGYEETTVAEIAREAGVAKGTFFNYFATKEDVLIQVVQAQLLWAQDQLGALQSGPGPYADGVRGLMVRMVTRLPYTAPLLQAMFRSSLTSSRSADGFLDPSLAMVQALVPVMAAGQGRGEFRSDLPAETLAYLTVQTYFGVLLAWSLGPGQVPLGDAMSLTFETFFHGVCRR